MYCTVTVSPAVTGVPEPFLRSTTCNDVGGGPIGMSTLGAPAGSGSASATHGLPAADAIVEVVLVAIVVVVVAAVLESDPGLLSTMNTPAITTTAATVSALRSTRRRRLARAAMARSAAARAWCPAFCRSRFSVPIGAGR